MSVKMMNMVFERFKLPGNDKVLALALADHAHDDGTHIWPGNEKLAYKTCMCERTVIRLLQKFVKMGWLIKTKNSNYGRGIAAEYRINPEWISGKDLPIFDHNSMSKKGDNLSSFIEDEKGDKNYKRVTPQVKKGDTAMSPQPSLTINTTIISAHARDESTENRPMRPEGEFAIRLRDLKVNATSMHPMVHKWVQDKIPIEFVIECVAVARLYQPLPKKISLGYLDSIVRDKLSERAKPKVDNAWKHDDAALERKGRELNYPPRAGESYQDYRRRFSKWLDGLGGDVAA